MRLLGRCQKQFASIRIYFLSFFLFALLLGVNSTESFAAGITVIPDVSVIVQIVNFLVLIWILNIILYKPIRNIISQRKMKVNGLENDIKMFKNDIEEKDQSFSEGIKSARKDGMGKKDALIQEATDEEKAMIEKITSKAQDELASIRQKIKTDAEAVARDLEKEVDDFANAISEKILGRAV